MDALSPIRESSTPVAAGPSSSQPLPFLGRDVIGKILTFLPHRSRYHLHQNLVEKEIALRSRVNAESPRDLRTITDLQITRNFRRTIELVDKEYWAPFQDFLNRLSVNVERLAPRELHDQLVSAVSSLSELKNKEATFYEKEADFFVILFKLPLPLFNCLWTYYGETPPLITQAIMYREFAYATRTPQLSCRSLAKADGAFFPAHKILPLLPPDRQIHCAISMLCPCIEVVALDRSSSTVEYCGEELFFFGKKLVETMDIPSTDNRMRYCYFLHSLESLINCGCVDEAKELDRLYVEKKGSSELWDSLGNVITTNAYNRETAANDEKIISLLKPYISNPSDHETLKETLYNKLSNYARARWLYAKILDITPLYDHYPPLPPSRNDDSCWSEWCTIL